MSEADPMRLVQLTEAAALAQVAADIDNTGKGNLLKFAGNDTIGEIGALYGKRGDRLPAAYARTILRYNLSTARSSVTLIPVGHKVTPDNKIYFRTLKILEIPAGKLSGDVEAECMAAGEIGNQFQIGDIKNMVDLVPFIASVENIAACTGGSDIEGLEEYRERIRMLPESFSTAGPDGAYEFWARTANPGITDAKVWMPDLDLEAFAVFLAPWGITDVEEFYTALGNYYRESGTGPGNVNIAVLMKDGELPSKEVKEQVFETLSDKRIRPLTDFVHVKDPEPIEYNINVRYGIYTRDATMAQSIIDSVDSAIQRFIAWQKNILGRDINPSYLHQLIMECGVKRAVIEEPATIKLEPWQVGILSETPVQVTFEGLEDE
jgi:phage-related baseplate assembly protein